MRRRRGRTQKSGGDSNQLRNGRRVLVGIQEGKGKDKNDKNDKDENSEGSSDSKSSESSTNSTESDPSYEG